MTHAEESYRSHWAALTGRAPSEIYVPEALRPSFQVGDRVRWGSATGAIWEVHPNSYLVAWDGTGGGISAAPRLGRLESL